MENKSNADQPKKPTVDQVLEIFKEIDKEEGKQNQNISNPQKKPTVDQVLEIFKEIDEIEKNERIENEKDTIEISDGKVIEINKRKKN